MQQWALEAGSEAAVVAMKGPLLSSGNTLLLKKSLVYQVQALIPEIG